MDACNPHLIVLVLGILRIWYPAHDVIQKIGGLLYLLLEIGPVLNVEDDPLVGAGVLHRASGRQCWHQRSSCGHVR